MPFRSISLSIVGLALLAGAYAVATRKGVWFDELFSLYEARHIAPFSEMFWRHWMVDGHPPLFNMANWAVEPLVGDDIEAARALNLIPFGLAGAALLTMGRQYPTARNFLWVFALLMLGSPVALEQFVEHRANFTQLAASAVIVAAFGAIALTGSDYAKADRPLALILLLAALFAFNLHYIGSLSAGAIVGIFAIANWIARRRRWGAMVFAIAVLAALPLAASLAAQAMLLTGYTKDFWITTSNAAAVKTIGDLFLGTAKANLVVTAGAVFGLAAMRSRRDRRPPLAFAITCLVAATLVCFALFIVNSVRPIILLRYLVTEVPLIAGALAALAADVVATRRWGWAAATLAAVLTLMLTTTRLGALPYWNGSAQIVATTVRSCPATAVHAPLKWSAEFTDDGPDYANVMRYGYETVGRRFGFVVEPESSTRVDRNCPTIVWIEHFRERLPSPADAARGFAIAPASVAQATTARTPSGFVVIFPAARGDDMGHQQEWRRGGPRRE